MKSKFIILSFDAVDTKDFELLKTLPNFKELMEHSSYSTRVESVYPSLTYPAHTSISTGLYPVHHGVINNIFVQPERKREDWFWYRKYIHGTTIYDTAKELGFRTCTLLWPVTGSAKSIDLNLPEIFPNRPFENQILVSAKSGSPKFQLKLNKLFGHMRNGYSQPKLDNFTFASLMYVLENDLADFIMVHLTDTDWHKHKFGVSSTEVSQSLKRQDLRLGQIIDFLKTNNIYDSSTLIALGDHSFKDAKYVIKLNRLFLENNYIQLDKKGNIKSYKAYCNFCDGSAYIYVNDKSVTRRVFNLLEDFSKNNDYCIKEFFSSDMAKTLGASDNCTFMLEAKEGYYFINDITPNIIESTEGKYDVATHGYSPKDESYKTIFLCKNPFVKPSFDIGPINLVDEGATIFKLLGHVPNNLDGEVLENIFIK